MPADRPTTTEPRTLPRTQAGRDMVAWQAGIGGWDRAYWEKRVREVEDQAFALAEAAQGAAPRSEGLDVERLAKAMASLRWAWLAWTDRPLDGDIDRRSTAFRNAAEKLAAAYSRPSDERVPESEEPR